MFFSADEDNNKVLCMAQVPKEVISSKGLKANEWCQQVQGIIAGKGGGKPENAQASGTNYRAMNEAIKVAIGFAESKLGTKMPALNDGAQDDSVNVDDFVMVEKPAEVGDSKGSNHVLKGRVGSPNMNMVLVAAKYAQVDLQLVPGDQNVVLETSSNIKISSAQAILHYLSNCTKVNLMAKQDHSQVLQWIFHAVNDVQPMALNWVLRKKKDINILQHLEDFLRTRTFLVGERLSLADIAMSTSIMPLFQFALDEKERKAKFPNSTRWFNTCLHQREFLSTLGTVQLK